MLHLLVASGSIVCALPLDTVVETMRPLDLEPVQGAPPAVLGLSMIRGTPIPVVDLARTLGRDSTQSPTRYVVLKCALNRWAALAVDAVLDIEDLDTSTLDRLPPLVASADTEVISAIGTRDNQFLQVLQTGRIIPEEVWSALQRVEEQD